MKELNMSMSVSSPASGLMALYKTLKISCEVSDASMDGIILINQNLSTCQTDRQTDGFLFLHSRYLIILHIDVDTNICNYRMVIFL